MPSRAPGVLLVRRGPAGLLHRCLCVGTQGRPRLRRAFFSGRDGTVSSVRGAPHVERDPSALQGSRSTLSPAPQRQEGQQRRSRISRGHSIPAAILFFFPLRAGRAAALDRSLPFASAHLNRLLGIQGSQGESKRHPSLGKTALAMGG
ncbi:hypothetical protein NDU88_007643 [Pleurodeles waltl]|uniref:Uncharacterized protein n=1 Tax=Pleurodeles waltl TaxID=8319 RepID=A0AAV7RTT7_PLEWA|nr:hypothetical protein NDU88_007643 [Pleurodeles waltl]